MRVPAPGLPPARPDPENEVKLTFIEHLRQLRRRFLHVICGVAVGMGLVGGFVPRIVDGLMAPVRAALPSGRQTIVYTSAIEPMMVYRRHAIEVNIALAAFLTPTGDPFNLALMAVPMILFYEVGIVLARVLGRKPEATAD